jgi:hypothetical protein
MEISRPETDQYRPRCDPPGPEVINTDEICTSGIYRPVDPVPADLAAEKTSRPANVTPRLGLMGVSHTPSASPCSI